MTDTTNNNQVEASNSIQAKLHRLRKVIPDGVPEELEAMDATGLKNRIVQCELNIHETEQAKEADTELAVLQERIKDMKAPYTDAKKVQTAIAQYASIQLILMGQG